MAKVMKHKIADGGDLYSSVGTAMPLTCVGYKKHFTMQHLHQPEIVLTKKEARALRAMLKVWLDE